MNQFSNNLPELLPGETPAKPATSVEEANDLLHVFSFDVVYVDWGGKRIEGLRADACKIVGNVEGATIVKSTLRGADLLELRGRCRIIESNVVAAKLDKRKVATIHCEEIFLYGSRAAQSSRTVRVTEWLNFATTAISLIVLVTSFIVNSERIAKLESKIKDLNDAMKKTAFISYSANSDDRKK